MTVTLDRPTISAAPREDHTTSRTAGRAAARPTAVTITVSVTLPEGTGDVESALLADELRTHAQRLTAARGGRTTVSVSTPQPFRAAPGTAGSLPPRHRGSAAVSPLRPRRAGVVSPNSPARRDAEAARRRALLATAVSPISPATAPLSASLVIDLHGRRVRIDGQDVDFTYKEFELLAHLARQSRTIVSREQLMESVWAEAPEDTGERTVDVHIRRVRTKLGRYRKLISTVRGAGYRLDPGSDVAILD